MLTTSQRYGDFVYSMTEARYFTPKLYLKIIDTAARQTCTYTASGQAEYSQITQLFDDTLKSDNRWGTLEDFSFLLNGSKYIMPDYGPTDEVGCVFEQLSDEDGVFTTPLELTCQYTNLVSTYGRTLFFDNHSDSVPKDFDIEYQKGGETVHVEEVRDNESYISITETPEKYNKLIITIYSTSKPYRRVRIIEDLPGILITFLNDSVVSISYVQTSDILSEQLETSELDIVVENVAKLMNILNPDGLETYMRKKQPIDYYLTQVFPDDSEEDILVGKFFLSSWNTPKGTIVSSFVARDVLDLYATKEYIKGAFTGVPTSFYDLAVAVFADASITKYLIDDQLQSIFTTACLPIAAHKELIRMIAQASQSVVSILNDGTIYLRCIPSLITAYNLSSNSNFDTGFTDWDHADCALYNTDLYNGKQCVELDDEGYIEQEIDVQEGHIYLISCFVKLLDTDDTPFYITKQQGSITSVSSLLITEHFWTRLTNSYNFEETGTALIRFSTTLSTLIDAVQFIDLTDLYGAGNEPSEEWCMTNIRYFKDNMQVPLPELPDSVDDITDENAYDTPDIILDTHLASISTEIYTYKKEATESSIYTTTKSISGTEEFTIKFNSIVADGSITAVSVDGSGTPSTPNTAVILSADIYSQAAVLKIAANSDVLITVTGKTVKSDTSVYILDYKTAAIMEEEGEALSISNKLITNKYVAENVTNYAAYWSSHVYTYDVDWRQNPAIENLDCVRIFDNFSVNNKVLLTHKQLNYDGGALSGNTKGIAKQEQN